MALYVKEPKDTNIFLTHKVRTFMVCGGLATKDALCCGVHMIITQHSLQQAVDYFFAEDSSLLTPPSKVVLIRNSSAFIVTGCTVFPTGPALMLLNINMFRFEPINNFYAYACQSQPDTMRHHKGAVSVRLYIQAAKIKAGLQGCHVYTCCFRSLIFLRAEFNLQLQVLPHTHSLTTPPPVLWK